MRTLYTRTHIHIYTCKCTHTHTHTHTNTHTHNHIPTNTQMHTKFTYISSQDSFILNLLRFRSEIKSLRCRVNRNSSSRHQTCPTCDMSLPKTLCLTFETAGNQECICYLYICYKSKLKAKVLKEIKFNILLLLLSLLLLLLLLHSGEYVSIH